MVGAAFGVRIFSDNVAEWQIDAVKEVCYKAERGGDRILCAHPSREGEPEAVVGAMD